MAPEGALVASPRALGASETTTRRNTRAHWAACYADMAFDVRSAMPSTTVTRVCGDLIFASPRFDGMSCHTSTTPGPPAPCHTASSIPRTFTSIHR